jgi:putative SOS response-associated peptidase YedK
MSNLYRLEATATEIARHFGASDAGGLDIPAEVKPGQPGVVVRKGGDGRRLLQVLRWGFPRPQKDRDGNPLHMKPVNLCADLTNPMWDQIAPDPRYRCLIPVTAFAQPAGRRGAMTRTWFSVKAWPLCAFAGFCKNTPEWGPVYAAMTTESSPVVAPLNPRMALILGPHDYEHWLGGSIDDVIDFQFRDPFPSDKLAVDATKDLWVPKSERRGRHEEALV